MSKLCCSVWQMKLMSQRLRLPPLLKMIVSNRNQSVLSLNDHSNVIHAVNRTFALMRLRNILEVTQGSTIVWYAVTHALLFMISRTTADAIQEKSRTSVPCAARHTAPAVPYIDIWEFILIRNHLYATNAVMHSSGRKHSIDISRFIPEESLASVSYAARNSVKE